MSVCSQLDNKVVLKANAPTIVDQVSKMTTFVSITITNTPATPLPQCPTKQDKPERKTRILSKKIVKVPVPVQAPVQEKSAVERFITNKYKNHLSKTNSLHRKLLAFLPPVMREQLVKKPEERSYFNHYKQYDQVMEQMNAYHRHIKHYYSTRAVLDQLTRTRTYHFSNQSRGISLMKRMYFIKGKVTILNSFFRGTDGYGMVHGDVNYSDIFYYVNTQMKSFIDQYNNETTYFVDGYTSMRGYNTAIRCGSSNIRRNDYDRQRMTREVKEDLYNIVKNRLGYFLNNRGKVVRNIRNITHKELIKYMLYDQLNTTFDTQH